MNTTEREFSRYVTYRPDGSLDGCYLQVPDDDHASRMIPFPEELVWTWASYRANADRTAIELIPENEIPGYEPPEEEPPVDPEPKPPVQSDN